MTGAPPYDLPEPIPSTWYCKTDWYGTDVAAIDPYIDNGRLHLMALATPPELQGQGEESYRSTIRAPDPSLAPTYVFHENNFILISTESWSFGDLSFDGGAPDKAQWYWQTYVQGTRGYVVFTFARTYEHGAGSNYVDELIWFISRSGKPMIQGRIPAPAGPQKQRISWDSAGRLHLEISADGATWTELAVTPDSAPLDNARVNFELGHTYPYLGYGIYSHVEASMVLDELIIYGTYNPEWAVAIDGVWVDAIARGAEWDYWALVKSTAVL